MNEEEKRKYHREYARKHPRTEEQKIRRRIGYISEEQREKNRQKASEYSKNKGYKLQRKAYREAYKHSEAYKLRKEKRRTYYQGNKLKESDRNKEYRQTEKYKKTRKAYLERTKEKRRIYGKRNARKEYIIKRKKESPQFKLSILLRNRLLKALKRKSKHGSAVKLLGCTVEQATSYLASKFKKGMTWDNHGKWHIDHIQPLSSFNLEDSSQLSQACHYTNLQPLWAKDNIHKHARRTQPHQLILEI